MEHIDSVDSSMPLEGSQSIHEAISLLGMRFDSHFKPSKSTDSQGSSSAEHPGKKQEAGQLFKGPKGSFPLKKPSFLSSEVDLYKLESQVLPNPLSLKNRKTDENDPHSPERKLLS